MFCKKCGHSLPEGARFCGKCGAVIEPRVPAAPVQPEKAEAAPVGDTAPVQPTRKPAPAAPKKKSYAGLIIVLAVLLLLTLSAAAVIADYMFDLGIIGADLSFLGDPIVSSSSPDDDDDEDSRHAESKKKNDKEDEEDGEADAEAAETAEAAEAECAHQWVEAACEQPRTCSICGVMEGDALGHDWAEATYTAPRTCTRCGATEGSKLVHDLWLKDLDWSAKFGKYYFYQLEQPDFAYNDSLKDTETNGYVSNVTDFYGNTYTYGFYLDRLQAADFYLDYDLNGEYTTFTGTIACASVTAGTDTQPTSEKWGTFTKTVEIYCDGTLVQSFTVTRSSDPVPFSIDVTGAGTLRIVYANTDGPNGIAAIWDARVSNR